MKKSILLFYVIFGLLFVNVFSCFSVVGSDSGYNLQMTFTSNPTVVAPGTNGYLEINLKSIGSGTIENINVHASSVDSSVIIPRGDWHLNLGDLDGGDSISALLEFSVSDNAGIGMYQINFEIFTSIGGSIKRSAIIKVEDMNVLDIISVNPNSINIWEVTSLTFNF